MRAQSHGISRFLRNTHERTVSAGNITRAILIIAHSIRAQYQGQVLSEVCKNYTVQELSGKCLGGFWQVILERAGEPV